MVWQIAMVVLIVAGLITFYISIKKDNTCGMKVGGIILGVGVVLMIIDCIPTDNYTDWETMYGNTVILQIEDNQYTIERDEEYLYKVLMYSDAGEKTEEYMNIEKDKNTSVEFVETENNEIATLAIFNRRPKSIFGNVVKDDSYMQTKYVFYVPTT